MKAIGWIGIFASIYVGLYLGVWFCFIGGIIQIFETIKAETIDGVQIGIGIGLLRMICAAPVGWLVFILVAFLSACFLEAEEKTTAAKMREYRDRLKTN